MQSHYQLIFVAPQNPVSQAEAIDNLARLYQTSKLRILRLLQQPQPILKRVKSLPEARKYQQALAQYGICCEICPTAPTVATAVKATTAATARTVAVPTRSLGTRTKRHYGWLKWVLLMTIISLGTGLIWQEYQQQRMTRYNDNLVVLLENSVVGFAQVLRGLSPYGRGQAVDMPALQHSFEQTMQQIQQARQQIQRMDVPSDRSCVDFQHASLAFLNYQMLEGERIADILAYVAAHNPGSAPNILILRKRLHRIGREEARYQQALQQAQERMAQQFQVALK